MPHCSAELEKTLKEKGLDVVTPEKMGLPAGSWNFEDGAIHCATLQITAESCNCMRRKRMGTI